MNKAITLRLIPALITIAFSGSAVAAGFQLQNQTGSGNGNAFAGAAAAAEDAGTIFFNPAGMSYLPRGHNISLSGTLLNRSIKFTDQGSTTTPGFGLGSSFPLPTGNGGDAGGLALLPHGYWAWGMTDSLSLGVGIGPTFGNTTEYDNNFVGRNAGFYFEMQQININPSVAWKVNEQVSLGFGINFAHNESHFKQGVPLVWPLGGYLPNNYLDVKGDDWAIGYNVGAMFKLTPSTRLGIAYRSELDFELEGQQKWNSTATGFGPVGPLVNYDVKAKLKTPANLSFALSQGIGDKFELLADLTWTEWSVVNTLLVNNQQTGAPLQKLSYNFRDTWRVGLGGNYQLNSDLKLRFGVAYDMTPVKSAADRTMTLPDADRTWLSVGAKYNLNKSTSLDFGYTHIFFADARTERQVITGYPGTETVRQTIRGEFKTSVDIVSMQLNYNF